MRIAMRSDIPLLVYLPNVRSKAELLEISIRRSRDSICGRQSADFPRITDLRGTVAPREIIPAKCLHSETKVGPDEARIEILRRGININPHRALVC